MPGFVKKNGHKFLRGTAKEGVQDHHLRHRIIGSAGMATDTPRRPGGRKKYNGITAELNISFEGRPLRVREGCASRIQRQWLIGTKIHRKSGVRHGHTVFPLFSCLPGPPSTAEAESVISPL